MDVIKFKMKERKKKYSEIQDGLQKVFIETGISCYFETSGSFRREKTSFPGQGNQQGI